MTWNETNTTARYRGVWKNITSGTKLRTHDIKIEEQFIQLV